MEVRDRGRRGPTLQLGLVQWVRGDAIVMLEPSQKRLRKFRIDSAKWERNFAWNNTPAPEYPVGGSLGRMRPFETELACKNELRAASGSSRGSVTKSPHQEFRWRQLEPPRGATDSGAALERWRPHDATSPRRV